MAATIKNPAGQVIKLSRGKPANLGALTTLNDAVAFTVPEPTRDNQGVVVIQVSGNLAATGLQFGMEASIDGGTSWFTVIASAAGTGAALFGDAAATASFTATISGFGSGAVFRFGFTAGTTPSGSSNVWALVG